MDTRGNVREGRCIDCGAKIEVVNGERSQCACKPVTRPKTEQEQQFDGFVEAYLQKFPTKPRL